MMQRVELLLPGLVTPSQNVTDREHWAKKKKRLADYQWAVKSAELMARRAGAKSWPQPGDHVDVTIISHRKRLLDAGNLVGGCKQLVDALVRLRLIKDDSTAHITEHYEQHQSKTPRTIVVMTWGGSEKEDDHVQGEQTGSDHQGSDAQGGY